MGSLALDAGTRAAIRGARLLLIEGYLWEMGATLGAVREAIAEARAAGAQVALTASDSTLVERHREDLLGVLAGGVDILFANADEARVLGGSEDVATASAALAGMCPLVATTDGHKGSCLYGMGRTHNVPPHWMPAPPVDTCGAGDAYAAGVLYALLQGAGLDGMGRAGGGGRRQAARGAPPHAHAPDEPPGAARDDAGLSVVGAPVRARIKTCNNPACNGSEVGPGRGRASREGHPAIPRAPAPPGPTLGQMFFLLMDIQTGWQDGRMGKMAQQHPDLPEGSARPSPGRTVLGLFIAGCEAICFLISWAILMKACSTFSALFAEVSRKGIPISSAKALAVAWSTTFFEVRSLLFPTSSLFTFSFA